MHIQRPINISAGIGAQSVGFPDGSGGVSPGAPTGMRVDWNVRINLSHAQGFVGGAGRVLLQNEEVEERSELVLYLPAAAPNHPGSMRLLSASICSAKPGMNVQHGLALPTQGIGERVAVTIPALRLNDWIFIDLTWDGQFAVGGTAWQAGAVPLGEFHPQIAVDITTKDNRRALVPLQARYEVILHSDPGATVRPLVDGAVSSHPSADGLTVEHEFRSFGAAQIQALVLPNGSETIATTAAAAGDAVETARPQTILGSAAASPPSVAPAHANFTAAVEASAPANPAEVLGEG